MTSRSDAPLDEPRLSLEVNRQIGDLQREGLTGNALALLNRCYLIIKGFEERLSETVPKEGTNVPDSGTVLCVEKRK